jgi:chromosomal replication initiation ATPase DnaA
MEQALFETPPGTEGTHHTQSLLVDNTRPDALKHIVEAAVAVVFAIDMARLRSGSRGRAQVAQARQVAMYLAHCAFGLSHTEVGRIFSRDRTTVAYACHIVEDRRDDPVFDRTLANLEEIVGRFADISGIQRET